MRIVMLALCCFICLLTSAHALEMYKCLDNNGNAVITSTPQDGMTDCVLMDSSEDSVPEDNANDNGSETKESVAGSGNANQQADEKLRRQCANLKVYREEERTYCEGVPQSYKSGNEEIRKRHKTGWRLPTRAPANSATITEVWSENWKQNAPDNMTCDQSANI